MDREEEIIAIVESVSRFDVMIRDEELILAAWPKDGNSGGHQYQINRVMAMKRARAALMKPIIALDEVRGK